MTAPVRLDVFSDYLCPWCYNAAVRLRDVQQAYGDRVRVHWRTFPLIPGEQPDRRVTEKTREGRQRVGAEEPRARFVPPEIDTPLPASSIPALTAAKCAERQGADAFERFHDRLFTAHFGDNLDISRPDVLRRLAREPRSTWRASRPITRARPTRPCCATAPRAPRGSACPGSRR